MKKWLWFVGLAAFLLALDAGLALAVLTNAKTPEPKFAEALKFGFAMLAASSVIFTCFFNIWQNLETETKRAEDLAVAGAEQEREAQRRVEDQAREDRLRAEDRRWQRVENTLQLLGHWDQPALMRARDFVRDSQESKPTWSDQQLREIIGKDKDLDRSVRLLFNYCDDVLQSLRQERVAAEIITDSFAPAFNQIHDFFKAWIEKEPESYRKDLTELHRRLN